MAIDLLPTSATKALQRVLAGKHMADAHPHSGLQDVSGGGCRRGGSCAIALAALHVL